MYSSKGVKAVAIDCDTPKDERQDIIESFRQGNIQVLVNVEIFTEGFDCADVSFIQLARPTCSLALYLQQVGRGLRVVEGKEKTIIIDNVGLYNYFGLPDADRDWQFYFNGQEAEGSERQGGGDGREAQEKEDKDIFAEDDEEMLIIKGGNKGTSGPNIGEGDKENEKKPQVEEFTLRDYYLVHGNKDRFQIYPFVKKRGKRTEDIGKCVLDYDSKKEPLTFTYDTDNNIQQLARNVKIQSVVAFCAALSSVPLRKFLDLSKAYIPKDGIGLYDLLRNISKEY